ncbi:unnamed protein product [Arctogadus glacialis]
MQRSLYDTFPDPLDYTGTRGFSTTHLCCTPTQTLPLAQVPTSENRAATPMDLPFPDTNKLKGGWTVQASAGMLLLYCFGTTCILLHLGMLLFEYERGLLGREGAASVTGIPLEYGAPRHGGEIFTQTALTLMEIPCPPPLSLSVPPTWTPPDVDTFLRCTHSMGPHLRRALSALSG